jgi:hypothetical protein
MRTDPVLHRPLRPRIACSPSGLGVLVTLPLAFTGCLSRDIAMGSRCPEGVDVCLADGGADAALPGRDACVACSVPEAGCAGCDAAVARSACQPARYAGHYVMPNYYPVAAGLCGVIALFGGGSSGDWFFNVSGARDAGTLVFEAEQTCLGFNVLSLDAGLGAATPDAGPSVPVFMTLSGAIDCTSGQLSGEVRGAYHSVSVCNGGTMENDYSVKGFVSAVFDPRSGTFVSGMVDLREPGALPLDPSFGGKGSWEAQRVSELTDPPERCPLSPAYVDFPVTP